MLRLIFSNDIIYQGRQHQPPFLSKFYVSSLVQRDFNFWLQLISMPRSISFKSWASEHISCGIC